MITAMRKGLKDKGFKIILWLIISTLIIAWSLSEVMEFAAQRQAWLATVDGYTIDYNDFVRKVTIQEEQLRVFRAQYGEYADLFLQAMGLSSDPKSLAFDQLVRETLLNQVSDALSLYLHPDYIADKLHDPQFTMQKLTDIVPFSVLGPTGVIDMQKLKMYLRNMKLSMTDFEQKVGRVLQRQLVEQLTSAASYAPELELREQYAIDHAKKKFSILSFSREQFLKEEKAQGASGQELKDFFDQQNRQTKRYWVPQKRSGVMWKFDPGKYGITVSDAEVESYYENHKAKQFVEEPTKIQMRRILFKVDRDADSKSIQEKAQKMRAELIQDPATFADVARNVSEDKETAEHGGLMPFFARGTKERAFEKAAFLLQKDGDISNVIRTGEGLEIVQRVSKKLPEYKPLNKVKQQIRDKLVNNKFKGLFTRDMSEVLDQMNTDQKALEAFIAQKGGKAETIDSIVQDELKRAQTLFKLTEGDSSFYIEGKTGIAVKLTKIHERHLPALETIKDVVTGDLYEERARKQLAVRLDEAKKALQSDMQQVEKKPFEELRSSFGGSVERTEWLHHDDKKGTKALSSKGIPVDQIVQLGKKGAHITHESDKQGFLIRLDEIEPFNEEDFTAKKADISRKMGKERAMLWSNGFIASLHRNATIKLNETLSNIVNKA